MVFTQIGSSLVQILVAASVVTGSSVYLMNRQSESSKIQAKQSYNQDILGVDEHIQIFLSKSPNCTESLNAIKNNQSVLKYGNVKLDPQSGLTNYFNTEAGDVFLSPGSEVGKSGAIVENISLHTDGGKDFIRFKFKIKEGQKVIGGTNHIKDYPLHYFYNPQGDLDGCFSVRTQDLIKTLEEYCLSIPEADYDAQKRCLLKNIPSCVYTLKDSCSDEVWKEGANAPKFITKTENSVPTSVCHPQWSSSCNIPAMPQVSNWSYVYVSDPPWTGTTNPPNPEVPPPGNTPVDGGWSGWTASVCATSPVGHRTYIRTCTNPVPEAGGKNCNGNNTKTEPDNTCLIVTDGGWTDWIKGSCTNDSERIFTRSCTSPSPSGGGKSCIGTDQKREPDPTCAPPVDGAWSDWVQGSCKPSGKRLFTRTCTNPEPQNGGKNCSGQNSEERNDPTCPIDDGCEYIYASDSATCPDGKILKDFGDNSVCEIVTGVGGCGCSPGNFSCKVEKEGNGARISECLDKEPCSRDCSCIAGNPKEEVFIRCCKF